MKQACLAFEGKGIIPHARHLLGVRSKDISLVEASGTNIQVAMKQ
jgi:hypothetical protein